MSEQHQDDMELDFSPDIYTLVDEEGNEQEFELLDILETDDDRYFALLPYFESSEDALASDCELVVLKSEMVDGEEMMVYIEDDEEYQRVSDIFMDKLSNMYEDELQQAEEKLNGADRN